MNYLQKLMISKKNGTLLFTIKNSINYRRHLFWLDRKELKELCFQDSAYKYLKRHYSNLIVPTETEKLPESRYNPNVWVCWLQGIENAPPIPQKCIYRMIEVFGKERVKIITAENFKDYVDLPEYIIKKWKKGNISHAHFSDILRTALLVKHGGTWIDSTVLLLDNNIPDIFMNSKLFVFTNTRNNSIIDISSWWISAYSNNHILTAVQKVLYAYWAKENNIKHYFLFHIIFKIVCEHYAEEWKHIPKFSNDMPHTLVREIFDLYDEERLQYIKQICAVQKLSNKIDLSKNEAGSLFSALIESDK